MDERVVCSIFSKLVIPCFIEIVSWKIHEVPRDAIRLYTSTGIYTYYRLTCMNLWISVHVLVVAQNYRAGLIRMSVTIVSYGYTWFRLLVNKDTLLLRVGKERGKEGTQSINLIVPNVTFDLIYLVENKRRTFMNVTQCWYVFLSSFQSVSSRVFTSRNI